MEDAVPALGAHDDLVAGLLEELALPPLPAHRLSYHRRLLTAQPVGRRQGKHQEGEQDMDPYGSPRFLWRMAQIPLLLGLFDTTVLDEAAIIIVIKGVQRLLHRGIGQEHGCAARI